MVAGLDVGNILTDRLDHRGAFMAQYRRGGVGVQPLHEMQVRMAQAGKGGAQQHFSPLGFFDVHVLDGERLVRCVKDRGFHYGFPPVLIRLKP